MLTAIAAIRRSSFNRTQWALGLAIVFVVIQAIYIGTRLAPGSVVPGPTPGAVSAPAAPPSRTVVPLSEQSVVAQAQAPVQPEAVSAPGSTAAVETAAVTRPPGRRAAPRATARLVVRSDPAGAAVTVDGRSRGITPLTVNGLAPGPHRVVVHGPTGDVEHAIVAEAGIATTVVASLPAGNPAGWIAVTSPALLQIFEGDELLGTSASPRIMLPAGLHRLDLVNDELGYRGQQTVDVSAGGTIRVSPELPAGIVHINALPWAEVWIDGRRVGETPIGNLHLPIGSHEVVFRHPALGEVRRTVVATLRGPARVAVDLEGDRD